jgi:hypothetical protein
VQKAAAGEIIWFIERKGRVWESTAAKDEAMKQWCERVSAATGVPWRYARINQVSFRPERYKSMAEMLDGPVTLLA